MWMVPPRHLAIDIETIAGDPSGAEAWMRRAWTPSKAWKPETIGRRWIDACEKKEERLALLDEAPIISVAMRTESDCRVIHWMDFGAAELAGAKVIRTGNEAEMLSILRDHLDVLSDETVIVGHNIKGFDMRKLRHAMIRHKLRQPACLTSRDQLVFDSMREFSYYTLDDRKFVSLDEVLDVFGMQSHKSDVSGADVGGLYDSHKYEELLTYAIADVVIEYALFLRMTGQVVDAVEPVSTPQQASAA